MQTRERRVYTQRVYEKYFSIPARSVLHLPAARGRSLCKEKAEAILHHLGTAPPTDVWRQSNINESIRVKWVHRLWVCIHRSIHHLTDLVLTMGTYEQAYVEWTVFGCFAELTHNCLQRYRVMMHNSNEWIVIKEGSNESEGVILCFTKNEMKVKPIILLWRSLSVCVLTEILPLANLSY